MISTNTLKFALSSPAEVFGSFSITAFKSSALSSHPKFVLLVVSNPLYIASIKHKDCKLKVFPYLPKNVKIID